MQKKIALKILTQILITTILSTQRCFPAEEAEHPLFAAIEKGHKKTVKRILKEKPHAVSIRKSHRRTPLHMAIILHEYDIARYLVSAGSPIDAEDQFGNTPLLSISFTMRDRGSYRLAKILIDAGASVNRRNRIGTTPLKKAIYTNNLKIARILLEAGTHINDPQEEGVPTESYLHTLAEAYSPKMAHLLIVVHHADVNQRGSKGETALHHACKYGNSDYAKFLLKHGADIDAVNTDGESPLFITTQTKHTNLIYLLLARGARIDSNTRKTCIDTLQIPCEILHQEALEQLFATLKSHKVRESTGFPHDVNSEILSFLSQEWQPPIQQPPKDSDDQDRDKKRTGIFNFLKFRKK